MDGKLAPGLSRKLKKVLECRTDSPDVLSSLNTLSSFYAENTPQSRRNLRSSIEKRGLSINVDFLEASRAAQQALDCVEDEVNALANCCDKIAKALGSCSATTGDIITTTERLKQELNVTTQRQQIVSCFLRDYQLSNQEINALREEELNESLFKALSHVQEIHANCKLLLRTHHQRAGLELMDMMAVYQEGAYERLCRWVQAECRQLGDSDNPQVSDLLRTAVRCLKERPVLFKYCAEEVANMRHNALFRRFISALTRGGPGGVPRPIEVHAHDPLRYVGDMLGWLHQALASERELVLALLDPDSIADSPTTNQMSKSQESNPQKIESDITFVLDRIFEGVCRPFKLRVEQVLQSQSSLIIAYKLSNTLEFYSYTISDLLGSDTALSNTLWTLKDAAQKTFFDILKIRGERLLRYPPLVAVDLSPPPAVREGVSVLLELVETYNSMMLQKKPPFDQVISAVLDPIIQTCEQAAEAHKSKGAGHSSRRNRMSSDSGKFSKSSVDTVQQFCSITSVCIHGLMQSSETSSKIFLINCLCAIQQPLLGHEVAAEYVKSLGTMIDRHIHGLVENEVDAILKRCGLSNKMSHFRDSANRESGNTPLVEIEDTSPAALSESLKAFFGLVLGSDSSLPEFEQMQVPKLRAEACIQVAKALAEIYDLTYEAIMNPKNGYSDPKSLARHPPDQIRTILGI